MIIYLIVFISSCFFAHIADTYKKNKIIFVSFSIISIIIPSVLAGLRTTDIGTDVKIYIEPIVRQIGRSDSLFYLQSISDLEFLFASVAYFIIKIFSNINVFLFVIQLFICSLVYISLMRKSDVVPVWLGLFVFYCIFFNRTLNLMRQFMAIAVVLYATKYLENENPIKYTIAILIAMGFHSSAIIAILFYPVFVLFKSNKNIKIKPLSLMVILVILVLYNNIIRFLVYGINLLPEKYYLLYKLSTDNFNFQYIDTLYRIGMLVLMFGQYKGLKKLDKFNSVYVYLLIVDIIILQLGNFTEFAYRISLYTSVYMIFIIPQLVKVNKINKDLNFKLYTLIIVASSLTYWFYIYVFRNSCETFPYKSILK